MVLQRVEQNRAKNGRAKPQRGLLQRAENGARGPRVVRLNIAHPDAVEAVHDQRLPVADQPGRGRQRQGGILDSPDAERSDQRQQAGNLDRQTRQQNGTGAVASNQPRREPRRNKVSYAQRDKTVSGLPRCHPQTGLHGQRHTEHKPGPDAEKEHRNQYAKANAAKLQQARRDQRVGILTLLFARIQRRQPAQRNNGEKHNLQRPRPVPLGAERHREQQAAKNDRQQHGSGPVDA